MPVAEGVFSTLNPTGSIAATISHTKLMSKPSTANLADSSVIDNNSDLKNKTTKNSKNKSEYVSKYKKPHMIIPLEDMDWASSQKPAIHKLWSDCWRADPYGSRFNQLNTTLKRSAFMSAKKALSHLFVFKPEKSITDGRETICWMVKNLHGSRISSFWLGDDISILESTHTDSNQQLQSTRNQNKSPSIHSKSKKINLKSTRKNLESALMDSIDDEMQSDKDFQKPLESFHKSFQKVSETTNSGSELVVKNAFSEEPDHDGEQDEESPNSTNQDTNELPRYKELIHMGVKLDRPELIKAVAAFKGRIINPIRAFLDYASKKQVKDPTAAFITAIRKGWEPGGTYGACSIPEQVNPPSAEDLEKLEELKSGGVIADFYLSDDGEAKVIPFLEQKRGNQIVKVPDSLSKIPWHQFLTQLIPN